MTEAARKLVICRIADLFEGDFATRAVVDDVAYAVYPLGGRFYVSLDACTHGPGSLGEGAILGEEVECPFHQGRFHIPTGKPSLAPCTEPIRVWTGHLEGDEIWIDPDEAPSNS